MKVENPELINLLAERYVLGVQHGAARRRFASIAAARPDVSNAIRYWEARLTPLAWSVQPMQPSELVWQRIRRELGIGKPSAGNAPPASGRWAALAAMFAFAALIMAGGGWRAAHRPPEVVTETVIEPVPESVAVALINGDDGQPLWLTRIAPLSGELSVRVVNDDEARPDNDYELWALTDAGVPVSLGLLPQAGERQLTLTTDALTALASSSTVAVSLEPPGGSPQPTPSGPVLYTAALLAP
jgi:anti-sigma-K factor RskA